MQRHGTRLLRGIPTKRNAIVPEYSGHHSYNTSTHEPPPPPSDPFPGIAPSRTRSIAPRAKQKKIHEKSLCAEGDETPWSISRHACLSAVNNMRDASSAICPSSCSPSLLSSSPSPPPRALGKVCAKPMAVDPKNDRPCVPPERRRRNLGRQQTVIN